MGKWIHRLSEIDTEKRTAICANCGLVRIQKRGKRSNGEVAWQCSTPSNRPWNSKQKLHRTAGAHLKELLECANPDCTATIADSCQLDIHHVDGNHSNNDLKNLLVLCANCHRLHHRGFLSFTAL